MSFLNLPPGEPVIMEQTGGAWPCGCTMLFRRRYGEEEWTLYQMTFCAPHKPLVLPQTNEWAIS